MKHIVQHRRGTATEWNDYNTIKPEEGEIVIEIDEENFMHKLKIGDGMHNYSELAYLQAGDEIVTQVLPRVMQITLNAQKWSINNDATSSRFKSYGQIVDIEDATTTSRLDLQPSVDMLAELKELGISFVSENKNGVITVYVVGNKPEKDYSMQATLVETNPQNDNIDVIGIPIGSSGGRVDMTFNPESENAQSGIAVVEAVSTKANLQFKEIDNIDVTLFDGNSFKKPDIYTVLSTKVIESGIVEITFSNAFNLWCDTEGIFKEGCHYLIDAHLTEDSGDGITHWRTNYFAEVIDLEDKVNIADIDQSFNPDSENAQSGKAVAEAVSIKADLEIVPIDIGSNITVYDWFSDDGIYALEDIQPADDGDGNIIGYTLVFDNGNIAFNINISSADFAKLGFAIGENYKLSKEPSVKVEKIIDLKDKVNVTDIDQSFNPESENAQSGIAVKGALDQFEDNIETIIGDHLKTINGNSLVGDGNIEIGSNGVISIDNSYNPNSPNAQSGVAVSQAISQIKIPEIDTSDLVGRKTPEGGEIFNDYERNKALGEGTTARGINTTAGTKAFKIISINESQSEGSPIDISSFGCSPGTGVKSGDVLELIAIHSYPPHITDLSFNEFVIHLPGFNTEEESIAYANNLGFFEGNKYKIVFTVDEASSKRTLVSATPVAYDKSGYDITVHASVLEGATPYAIGDLLQIEGQNHQNNSYTIEAISEDGTIITAVEVDDRMAEAPKYNSKEDPNNSAENPTFDNPENWLYVAGKNEVTNGRISPQFVGASAGGVNSVSSSWASFAYGRDVKATGNYAFAVGRNTLAAYGGAAFGRNSEAGISSIASGGGKATGTGCVALGVSNTADFYGSVALGYETKSHARGSVALGYGVITNSQNTEPSTGYNGEGQVILGKFNAINPRIAFAIGNGTSDSNRSNIFEVRKDGKAYTLDKKLATEDELTTGLNAKPGTLYNGNYVFGNSTSTITGSYNTVFGNNNQVTGGVVKTFIAGDSNTVSSNFASSLGVRNTIGHYASMTFGDNLTTSNFRQIVVGWSNDTDGTYNARFVVGNGDSDKKSTAFMVMQDGSAELQTQGSSDNSVVIKKTLDDKFLVGTEEPSIVDAPIGTFYFQII